MGNPGIKDLMINSQGISGNLTIKISEGIEDGRFHDTESGICDREAGIEIFVMNSFFYFSVVYPYDT